MSDIKVIDNLLDKEYFKKFQEQFMSSEVPWIYADNVIGEEDLRCDPKYNYQFALNIYKDFSPKSQAFEMMHPLVTHPELGIAGLFTIKANMNLATDEIQEHGFHTDAMFNCRTAVFFINTNNGYTLFEDGTKVESVANRIVTFPSNMEHSGTSCTDEKRRLVINLNYFEAEFFEVPKHRHKYFGIQEPNQEESIVHSPYSDRRLIY
jgi:hypothetical protein